MRHSLLWKLLAINVPVIAAVILVLWLTIDYLAADYFAELMERYKISPEDTHRMFLDAVAQLPEGHAVIRHHPDASGDPAFVSVRLLRPHQLRYTGRFQIQ